LTDPIRKGRLKHHEELPIEPSLAIMDEVQTPEMRDEALRIYCTWMIRAFRESQTNNHYEPRLGIL